LLSSFVGCILRAFNEFFKTRHCNKPTLISKTEYKIVKTMTVKLIEIEVVFEINEA